MTDISPRYENGEPRCDGDRCDQYRISCGFITRKDNDCIPALRRQRDEAVARAEKVEVDLLVIEQLVCEAAPLSWLHANQAEKNYGRATEHAAKWEKDAYAWLHRNDKKAEAERLFPKEGGK